MQIIAIVVSLAIAAVGTALFVRAIRDMLGTLRVGQPAPGRADDPARRTLTLVKETLGHTRMLQWTWVGIGHWFIFVGFGLLFFTLLTAFGQLFDAHFALPVVGHFFLYEWLTEFFTVVMIGAIIAFIAYRASRPKERVRGVKGRFFRSTMWQGYFVEAVILSVGLCIIVLRGLEYALFKAEGEEYGTAFHFPFTFWIGEALGGLSVPTLENLVHFFAMLKIVVSFTWMIVISLNLTMGVAWHRFTAFFNIWFKRESSGRTALGAVKPLTSGGQRVSLDDVEEMDEDTRLGVGAAEDFSWKNVLDFTSCTECGRCQSQCPAWNTDKPLNPKLLITALRDHTYAKAPYLRAAEGDREAVLAAGGDTLVREVERPLVGDTADDEWFYMPESGSAVIDSEVLWNCTSCGACVQQCPVDIEHVDHIIDMRRYQLLVENNFPAELNQLFKGLEGKGNPWNMSPQGRMDWAKDLPFEVKVVGETVESLDEVEWLFWVGCAGAYEDRAKKTTRAVAELLDIAGVSFGVLGNGETCTGDPARRAGNEFVFQGLAQQNAETFKEMKVKKVVSACAHCFNTLKNEYSEFGVELEVVHHTQLLNRLVREGRLTPVKDGAGAHKRSITYHDPCYIGRHNGVYTPPRELLQVLPGAEVKEMPRNSERSFCCGAGGARMWMEENTGERINMNRTDEAVATGADQIAVGCPFCRVMLSDGLTMKQSKGEAREEVEVLDVAQMLLASVKGAQATKLLPGEGAAAGAGAPAKQPAAAEASTAGTAAGTSAGGTAAVTDDEALKAEPQDGDVTQTEDTVTATEDAGPLAKASGGSSLFDDPAGAAETTDPAKAPAEEAQAAKPASSGGSLFDLGGDDADSSADSSADSGDDAAPAAEAAPAPAAASGSGDLGGGGSLFDLGGDDAPAAEAPASTPSEPAPSEPAPSEPASSEPAASADLGSGGSLFDLEAPAEPAAATAPASPEEGGSEAPSEAAAEAPTETEASTTAPAAAPAQSVDLSSGGSLFDLEAPAEPAAPPASAPVAEKASTTDEEADGAPAASEAADRPADGQPEEGAGDALDPTDAAPAEEQSAAPRQAAGTPVRGTTGSLFDIAAPRAASSAAPAAPAAAAATPEPEPEPELATSGDAAASSEIAEATEATGATEAGDNVPSGADVSSAATSLGDDSVGAPAPAEQPTAAPAEAEAQAEEESAGPTPAAAAEADAEVAAAEQVSADPVDTAAQNGASQDGTAPADAGPAHTPRTDADIAGSSSLFDL
nr:(Fe-S)-binding protein [Nocardioides perillae]